jgi:hypothetical protein
MESARGAPKQSSHQHAGPTDQGIIASPATIKSYLVPVRVDVVSDDKSVRIVETLLWDPTCWPIPLTPPLHESVARNVNEIAHTLLSDLEVQGMGRTVRHFTGRVDLWTASLQAKIEDQLRPQLWQIAVLIYSTMMDESSKKRRPVPIKICLSAYGVMIKEDILWDVNVPDYSPLDFAKTMGEELNLPEEVVVAVATTIVEQLLGIPMDKSEDTAGSYSNHAVGATLLDHKENVSNIAHMVAYHRPS